jgi:metal-responsive CopG/Arc/MetJ family transcriptional regulator
MQSDAASSRMPKRLTVSLREDQYLGLEEVAEDLGMNLSDAAREAINAYLLREHWGDTIGRVAEKAIVDGATNDEALQIVLKTFPHAKTTRESIAWYRARMRRENRQVPTDREARERQRHRAKRT